MQIQDVLSCTVKLLQFELAPSPAKNVQECGYKFNIPAEIHLNSKVNSPPVVSRYKRLVRHSSNSPTTYDMVMSNTPPTVWLPCYYLFWHNQLRLRLQLQWNINSQNSPFVLLYSCTIWNCKYSHNGPDSQVHFGAVPGARQQTMGIDNQNCKKISKRDMLMLSYSVLEGKSVSW